jgi:hypothetical protein
MSDLIPGMYWGERHEKAPSFVKGRVSFHLERFLDWAKQQQPNERGYLNAQLLEKKDGSGLYFKLDTYQKPQGDRAPSGRSQGYADRKSVPYRAEAPLDDDLIPF